MIFAAPSLPSVSPILEILRVHFFSPRFFPSFLSVPLKFLLQQLDWFQMYVFCGFLKEINSRKIFWFKNFSGSNNQQFKALYAVISHINYNADNILVRNIFFNLIVSMAYKLYFYQMVELAFSTDHAKNNFWSLNISLRYEMVPATK